MYSFYLLPIHSSIIHGHYLQSSLHIIILTQHGRSPSRITQQIYLIVLAFPHYAFSPSSSLPSYSFQTLHYFPISKPQSHPSHTYKPCPIRHRPVYPQQPQYQLTIFRATRPYFYSLVFNSFTYRFFFGLFLISIYLFFLSKLFT